MKKLLFIPIILIAISSIVALTVSCKPSVKEKEAEINVQDAKQDLAEARKERNEAEWQNFKNDMHKAIDKNDAKIEQLKQDMKDSGKSANAEYEKKVAALKAKNEELKLKVDTYKNDVNSDWKSFKSEFNHDMDQLGSALKDLTVDNKK